MSVPIGPRMAMALVLMVLGLPVTAAAEQPEGKLVVEVSATATAEQSLVISLRFGELITEAIRLYSEPSHTLLAAVAHEEFAASEDGRGWQEE